MMRELERGFTLIELLVTMFLLSVALLAGGSLIVHSMNLDRSVVQTLNDPAVEQAIAWVRRDIHGAAALQTLSLMWTEGSLAIRGFDGSVIAYTAQGELLIRRQVDSSGAEMSRRIILRRLADWRWRSPTVDIVEVELAAGIGDGLALAAAGSRRGAPGNDREHRSNALFALRARGGRSW